VARRRGYEKRADELLEIADDLSAYWIETEDGGAAFRSPIPARPVVISSTRELGWLEGV
jgi:hypothetical protein